MKHLSTIFTISLFNFLVIASLVYFSPRLSASVSPETNPAIPPSAPSPSLSPQPSAAPASKRSTSTASPTVNTPTPDPLANRCVITVDGQRYDVTDFRLIHGGGDIFRCGTDMSVEFHSQHPQSYLQRIAQYKI